MILNNSPMRQVRNKTEDRDRESFNEYISNFTIAAGKSMKVARSSRTLVQDTAEAKDDPIIIL